MVDARGLGDTLGVGTGRTTVVTTGAGAVAVGVPPEQHSKLDFQDLKVALQKLPVDQREALLLVSASDMSYEEAAEVCGVAVGTIKSRVSRARTRLAELMGLAHAGDIGMESGIRASLATAGTSI